MTRKLPRRRTDTRSNPGKLGARALLAIVAIAAVGGVIAVKLVTG